MAAVPHLMPPEPDGGANDVGADRAETAPLPGRWHHDAPPSKRCPLGLSTRVRSLAAVVLIPSAVLLRFSPEAAAFVGFGLLVALALTQGPDDRWADDRDVALLEDPDDPDVCLVEVEIVRDGKFVGRDRGAAWFEGRRLLFSGHRTSFALGGEDVLPTSKRSWRRLAETLDLRVAQGEARVVFQTIYHGDFRSMQSARFKERLRDFRGAARPARGPRQWPPFEA